MNVVAVLGAAYLVAAAASFTAALRLRAKAATSPGALAMTGWWVSGAAICALQAVESFGLATGTLTPASASVLAIVRAAVIAVALAFLAFASCYLWLGRAPPIPLFVTGASALFVLLVWTIAALPSTTLVHERLTDALVATAPQGLLAWGAILLVPALAIVPLARSTVRAPRSPAKRRAIIVSLGILAGIAGFVAGGWGSTMVEPFTETIGVSLTGALVLAAYLPRREAAIASAAAS